jgi:hypothetical protein
VIPGFLAMADPNLSKLPFPTAFFVGEGCSLGHLSLASSDAKSW